MNGRRLLNDRPSPWQRLRVMGVNEGRDIFTDIAAQIENGLRVERTYENANLHARVAVGHLNHLGFTSQSLIPINNRSRSLRAAAPRKVAFVERFVMRKPFQPWRLLQAQCRV